VDALRWITAVFLDVSQTTTYRIVIPDKQTGPLPVIHCLDLEKLEIFMKRMKKKTMKVIGNLIKYIDTVFENIKETITKTKTKQRQIEIITFDSKDNRYPVET